MFQSAHPLTWGIVVSMAAAAASYLVPQSYAGEAVGLVFLAASYALCLGPQHERPPAHYGLALGGLLEPEPLRVSRMIRESMRAALTATALSCLILPPFILGFILWYAPSGDWSLHRALTQGTEEPAALSFLHLVMAHLLVIALPEEAFFRGYLQTALDDHLQSHKTLILRILTPGIFISSLIFALGHFATTPYVGRLFVFFPSLLFGLLRRRTRGIGAAVFFHVQCNITAALLGHGYGLY